MIFNSFTFDGVNSLDMGLRIASKDIYSAPERDFEIVEVPGRNGNIIIDNGRYKNLDVKYDVTFLDINKKSPELRKWLCHPGYRKLSDTYTPGYFRYASFNSKLEIQELLEEAGAASIIFDCKPYLYADSGDQWHRYYSSLTDERWNLYTNVDYSGVTVNPIYGIKCTGTGSITFGVDGGESVTFDTTEDPTGTDIHTYYVDCENRITYKDSRSSSGGPQSNIITPVMTQFYKYPSFEGEPLTTSSGLFYHTILLPRGTGGVTITSFSVKPNWRIL